MAIPIQFRRDNAATWTSVNPTLAQAEMGVELDTGKFKVGTGLAAWNSLAYGGLTGAAGTGLVNLTETLNNTSPNATIPVISMAPNNAATDVDVALSPKGLGGFSLQVADGTATGGNKRGSNAVDLQTSRLANTQVPNGTSAFCVGARNTASAANAMALGLACVASNTASVAMGNGCVASGANSFAVGNGNVALGNGGAAFGASSAANGLNSFVHGLQGTAFSVQARHVFSSGWHQVAGDNQVSRWRLKAATTDATPTIMTIDGAAATTTSRINLQLNNVFYFTATILGKQTAVGVATGVGCWTISGMVMMGTTVGSIILVGTPTVTAVSNTGTWGTPTITVDTTNGALIFTVTGKAATTIRWGATVITEEVLYA